ncbi:Linear gramicidin synthase subunit D Q70LM4, putative [Babesia ovata]|uniref:Linear gramicidin synthase subunit D Q70LM4, putative n=1 Tax=Babesia ovata TaxID=189622 RepID=A0A2H6KJD5_9APIC|nr:Linear gramicidin synthase subunit D Q70LM4, putative [Babesia ovata]GBE63089.1 Linear gramicidin synthase subunit D Q70LM4, putative [Babesia ovata]
MKGFIVGTLKSREIHVQLKQRLPQSVCQVGRPAEVVVYEAGRVQGVSPVGDRREMLWALGIIDAAAKQRGQGLRMVLVVVVVGAWRGGASDVLEGIEVGVTKDVAVGAVVMSSGNGGAQWRQR